MRYLLIAFLVAATWVKPSDSCNSSGGTLCANGAFDNVLCPRNPPWEVEEENSELVDEMNMNQNPEEVDEMKTDQSNSPKARKICPCCKPIRPEMMHRCHLPTRRPRPRPSIKMNSAKKESPMEAENYAEDPMIPEMGQKNKHCRCCRALSWILHPECRKNKTKGGNLGQSESPIEADSDKLKPAEKAMSINEAKDNDDSDSEVDVTDMEHKPKALKRSGKPKNALNDTKNEN